MTIEAPFKKSTKVGEQCTPSSSSLSITDLPSPILMEILFRLPIKTLLATKCVCRSWLCLINDPHFSKLHQARSKLELCFQSYYGDKETQLYMGSFHSLNDSHSLYIKLNTLCHIPKFRVSAGKYCFANSCNGLLCYTGSESDKFAVIWNPITSEFVTFPKPKKQKGLPNYSAFWLGFSRKANRFKLLLVPDRKGSKRQIAKICTIEKECYWRNVASCHCSIWKPFDGEWYSLLIGSFLHGALHWVGEKGRSSDMTIVYFDFEDEKFGTVPLPPHFKNKKISFPNRDRIGVLAGCLFVTDNTHQGINIWLMKEYGVQDSWTQVFSFQYTTLAERKKYTSCLPIDYMQNGEILMRHTSRNATELFLYDPVLKSIRVVGSGPVRLRVIAYSPSLVRLKDSMMEYDVDVRHADLELNKISTSPSWWKSKAAIAQSSACPVPEELGARIREHCEVQEEKQQQI